MPSTAAIIHNVRFTANCSFRGGIQDLAKNQIDFHFGFGLSPATPDRFFAVGYSFRIDRLGGKGDTLKILLLIALHFARPRFHTDDDSG